MLRAMSVPDGLLVLLRDGPTHGYQLATAFAARTAGLWSLNTGQVYTTLDRLARDGFVAPDGTDAGDARRRPWRLTPDGRDRAEQWLASVPPQPAARDELVLRVLLVAAADLRAALDVVDLQRRELVAHLQSIRKGQRAAGPDVLGRMAADAGAVRIESDLRWLDLGEERIRHALAESPVAPPPPDPPRAVPTDPALPDPEDPS